MNAYREKCIWILTLLFVLTLCQSALAARPVRVESANPAEAEQETFGLPVEISGNGFDDAPGAVTAVRFVLPGCTEEDRSLCPTGGVSATIVDVPSSKKILVDLDVEDLAIVDARDIEVEMTRGRGGKGTTLFNVKQKSNGGGTFTTCNAEYFPNHPAPGPCLDLNGGECDLGVGNPERIKLMIEDCVTSETIVFPNTGSLHSNANIESPSDYKTLTAVGPFTGRSVLANAGHRATTRAVNIAIGASVTNVGCGEFDLQNAVRFVLDGSTEIPDPEDPNRATLFYVNRVYVSTDSGPLCEAIVLERKQAYTDNTSGSTNDYKIFAQENNIADYSYIRTGIRYQGFKQQQAINPPRVDLNTIGAPDCGIEGAVGIIHGPLIARDFDSSSEALIEGNTVVMAGASCADTTGIMLLGDSDTDIDANINNNNVTGGRIGVLIDASASTDSVNMKGNTLTGTGGDAAVCSDISVDEKGKPNRINGDWDVDFDQPPCDGL